MSHLRNRVFDFEYEHWNMCIFVIDEYILIWSSRLAAKEALYSEQQLADYNLVCSFLFLWLPA